jgi:hypothetical protein
MGIKYCSNDPIIRDKQIYIHFFPQTQNCFTEQKHKYADLFINQPHKTNNLATVAEYLWHTILVY